MNKVDEFLNKHALNGVLPLAAEVIAAQKFSLSFREIELAGLAMELVPARYERNRNTISFADQITLLKSHVAVIGCGGLGGYIIEELARLGIGKMTVIDPDSFEDHNLNRQILCTIDALGMPKVDVAQARVRDINPAVEVIPVRDAFSEDNGREMLKGVQVACDGLDTISTRIQLGEICSTMGIPLIHGSIGGWYGQITTQIQEQHSVHKIYQDSFDEDGIEKTLGNPAFSPAFIASLQAAEVCKVLLGAGNCLAGRMLFFNLLDMEMETFQL